MIGIEDRPPTEREHVVLGGEPVPVARVDRPAGFREWAAARPADEPQPCHQCEEEGHVVQFCVYPHPGRFPADGVLTEAAEACHHCTWGGPGAEGLVARAERESVDDRDIEVDQLNADGRWVRFERWL